MVISDPRHTNQILQKLDGRNICNHENNVPSRLSAHGFMATHALEHMMFGWAHNHKSRPQVPALPQSHCGDNREGTLFS